MAAGTFESRGILAARTPTTAISYDVGSQSVSHRLDIKRDRNKRKIVIWLIIIIVHITSGREQFVILKRC